MPFQIIRDDITRVKADILVNTANPRPVVGGGTDAAIYEAAGREELLAARREIGEIAPGSAAVTPAFRLRAKHIIHTVGPVWIDGRHGEREILRACYVRTLEMADRLDAESIAFPLIATGTYGFPRDEALNIALAEIGRFLLTHEMNVILTVFDRRSFELSEGLMGDIAAYIDDHGVDRAREREYGKNIQLAEESVYRRRERENRRFSALSAPAALPDLAEMADGMPAEEMPAKGIYPGMTAPTAMPEMAGKSLEEVLGGKGKSFQQRLFELIDRSGMDDVTVYKKANIDRKVFSSIRCKPDYRPTKKTAVAFAIALRLDMPTMLDLLSRAEIAFSPSSTFDLIIAYFVTNGNYDIFEINAALFKFGQPILGG